ncbi:MAG: hypothetical protein ACLFVL_06815 [Candidatus Aenigmatarchaeota archaeon]
MELRLREFQIIEINKSVIRRYSRERFIHDFQYIEEEPSEPISLKHIKESSLEAVKKVDKKLRTPPYFLKAKTIRKEIGKELFIKSEYSDRWDTYRNTNRVNLPKFLKDMLPYVNKCAVKRLMCGKYFRKSIDSLLVDRKLQPLAQGPNSYAVLNPNKREEFFTEDVMEQFTKEFDQDELEDMTKDEEWVREVLGEESSKRKVKIRKLRGRNSISKIKTHDHRDHMYAYPMML